MMNRRRALAYKPRWLWINAYKKHLWANREGQGAHLRNQRTSKGETLHDDKENSKETPERKVSTEPIVLFYQVRSTNYFRLVIHI